MWIDACPSSRSRNLQLRYELFKQLIHVQQKGSGIPHAQLFTQRATLEEKPAKLMDLSVIVIEPVVAKSANDRPWHGCRSYFAQSRIRCDNLTRSFGRKPHPLNRCAT